MASRILCYSECQCVVGEVGSVLISIVIKKKTLEVSLCFGNSESR